MKTKNKLTDERKDLLLDIIALGIIENIPSIQMAERLKAQTGVEITEQNVSYYRHNHRDNIAERIRRLAGDLVKDCPITSKDFRLWALQEEFKNAKNAGTRLACIREARKEIDEAGDKIAEALKNSGNRVNIFEFGNISDEERESYQKQFGAYFNRFNGNGSRIHTTD